MSRKPITSDLLQAMGSQLNDIPVSAEEAEAQAATLEGLMTVVAELRRLPLKDTEPALIYAPEESQDD